jgi:hypothetical protein
MREAYLSMLQFARMKRPGVLTLAGVFALALGAKTASADTAGVNEARAAYTRATRAFDAGEFALAAREFARADQLVPSNAAMEAALEATLRADDAVLGITLVERAKNRALALDDRAKKAIDHVKETFANRVGRVTLPCDGARKCRGLVDGAEVEQPLVPVVVRAGHRRVRVLRDDVAADYDIDVPAGETVILPVPPGAQTSPPDPQAANPEPGVTPEKPPTPVGESREETRATGFGKAMTWTAAGLTLVAGGLTIASYVDLRSQRQSFERGACGVGANASVPPANDCHNRATRGQNAELRTGILLGATGALAITTAAFAALRPFRTTVFVDATPSSIAFVAQGPLP